MILKARLDLKILKKGLLGLFIVFSLQVKTYASEGDKPVRKLEPVPVNNVRVGGEIGRRIDLALENNILPLDVDKHLLDHFRDRAQGGYVGLGKLIDAYVHYSLYTDNKAVLDKDKLGNLLI